MDTRKVGFRSRRLSFYSFLGSLLQCSETTARSLFSELNFKYLRTRPGDYARKAALPTTMAHREEMLPILDFLESDDKFVVLYHDEPCAWVKSGASHDDPRKKSGAGLGKTAIFSPFFLLNFSVQVWGSQPS